MKYSRNELDHIRWCILGIPEDISRAYCEDITRLMMCHVAVGRFYTGVVLSPFICRATYTNGNLFDHYSCSAGWRGFNPIQSQ